jgi:excisionase family DNA binding protein
MEKIYELPEIEKLLKVSNRTLLRYINSKKLIATKVGGKWIVTEDNLQKLIKGE